MQVPTKANPTTKERSCKRGAVGAKSAGGINMILALLGGLRVWDGWLQPASLGARVLWMESPSSSGSSYPAEWRGLLRGRGAIAAERSLVSSN